MNVEEWESEWLTAAALREALQLAAAPPPVAQRPLLRWNPPPLGGCYSGCQRCQLRAGGELQGRGPPIQRLPFRRPMLYKSRAWAKGKARQPAAMPPPPPPPNITIASTAARPR